MKSKGLGMRVLQREGKAPMPEPHFVDAGIHGLIGMEADSLA